MRILFDMAVYDMRNKGNVALLQVAAQRISHQWPDASLQVITSAPYLLRLYCADALPVRPDLNQDWSKKHIIYHSLMRRVPIPILKTMLETREAIWRSKWLAELKQIVARSNNEFHPEPIQKGLTSDPNPSGFEDKQNMPTDISMVDGIDLFVATGAQYMSDACRDDALHVLNRLEVAIQLGIPAVMVGQGFGPITDSRLRARASAVLPKVDLIFIRENIVAPELLRSYGVDLSRVFLTGDDAIEMAYEARRDVPGRAIGVGLRAAYYTEVSQQYFGPLRDALGQAAEKFQAPLMAIPISHSAHELDDRVIGQLLSGEKNRSNGLGRFSTPIEIIQKVSECRLVVAGTFHAALFALAQGIPAIGLVKSTQYIEKFEGLADQFGAGCQMIYFDEDNFREKLLNKIENLWNSAEVLKPQLLAKARRQIQLGHCAYQQLYELVDKNKIQVN